MTDLRKLDIIPPKEKGLCYHYSKVLLKYKYSYCNVRIVISPDLVWRLPQRQADSFGIAEIISFLWLQYIVQLVDQWMPVGCELDDVGLDVIQVLDQRPRLLP